MTKLDLEAYSDVRSPDYPDTATAGALIKQEYSR